MARTKNEVLTIRTTAVVKALLKLAAERERRSAASMVEVLVLDYARAHGLTLSDSARPGRWIARCGGWKPASKAPSSLNGSSKSKQSESPPRASGQVRSGMIQPQG